MEWIFYTLFAATGFGAMSVVAKNIMEDTSSVNYAALYSLLALIFYTPVFLYYITTTNPKFKFYGLIAMILSMIGNVLAFLVYNYSVKEGQLSQVVPVTRLTPIFAAIIAAIALGEKLDLALASGIILATSGAIIILKEDHISYIHSLEDGIHTNAVKAALASALLYGMTSVADRYATQIIRPEIYNYFIYIALSSGFLATAYYKEKQPVKELKKDFNEYRMLYILTGLTAAASSLAIFKAFSHAPAAKVTTVQQFQVLIPVVAGVLMFNEKNLGRKLIGSIILITGIAVTAI